MRVFAICMTVAAAALAGCAAPPTATSTAPPVPAVPAAPPAPPAAPQPPSTQASLTKPVTASTAADDDEVICRNEKLLGTHIGKRVCKTRAQLRLEEQSAQETMKNRDRKGYGGRDPRTGEG